MANNKMDAGSLALENVLKYQEEVKAVVKSIANIEAAIEVHQSVIDEANGYEARLPELHSRREDLLAGMITGDASKDELAALDEEIRSEKERLDKFACHAAETVPDAKQTIAGLRRKLEAAVAEFEALKSQKPAVLASFLKKEAETIGAEYMRLAMGLAEKYRLLLAYGPIMRKINSEAIVPVREMVIPLFQGLKTHVGYDKAHIHGEIWDLVMIRNNPDVLNVAVKEERERIAELGVEW